MIRFVVSVLIASARAFGPWKRFHLLISRGHAPTDGGRRADEARPWRPGRACGLRYSNLYYMKSKKSIMGADNTDDVDEAFRAITNAQYSVSDLWAST